MRFSRIMQSANIAKTNVNHVLAYLKHILLLALYFLKEIIYVSWLFPFINEFVDTLIISLNTPSYI